MTTRARQRTLAVLLSIGLGGVGWAGAPVIHDLLDGDARITAQSSGEASGNGQQQGQAAVAALDRDAPNQLAVAAAARDEPTMPEDLHKAYRRLVGAVAGDVDMDLPRVLELAEPAAAEWRAQVTAGPAENVSDGFATQVHSLEGAVQQAAVCTRYGTRAACIEAEQSLVDVERWLGDQEDLAATEDPPLAPALDRADPADVGLRNGQLADAVAARDVTLPGFVIDTWVMAASTPEQIVPLLVDDTYDQAVSTLVDALYSGTTGEADDVAHVNRLVTAIRARDAMVEAAVSCAARGDDTAHCAAMPAWREHVRRTTERSAG